MDTNITIILSLVALASIASLVLLVRAFQVSAWWGVASLLIPFAPTIFGLCHFSRAKYSFLISHLSLVAIVVIAIQNNIPLSQEAVVKALGGSEHALVDPEELTSMIQEKRTRIEQLESQSHTLGAELTTQFAALNTKRTALKPGDAAAVEQFNAEAAAYDVKNKTHKAVAAELESTREELQKLLDERSRRSPEKKR